MPDINSLPDPTPEGVYEVKGVFVGTVGLLEASRDAANAAIAGTSEPPQGLPFYSRLLWRINHEFDANPLTSFELYLSCVGIVWGAFLMMNESTFDEQGKLWLPLRTLFGSRPGGIWYGFLAEMVVGFLLVAVHSLHVIAICQGKRFDGLRRITICSLFSGWMSLCLLFYVADPHLPSYMTVGVGALWLLACIRSVFRKAAVR